MLSQPGRERHQLCARFIRFSPEQHVTDALEPDVRFEGDEPAVSNILRSKHRWSNQKAVASQRDFVGRVEMAEALPRPVCLPNAVCSAGPIHVNVTRSES